MNKKLYLIPAIALIALLTYTSIAKADNTVGPWHQEMVSQLATKLGVSQESVDSALTEVGEQRRAEHQYQMQVNLEDRLQTLIDEGKLTASQRDAWLNKHEELQAEREVERATHHDEMQAWFAEQGIDPTIIGSLGQGNGFGKGRGQGMGMHSTQ
ncbi:MAG: hypothetical protein ABII80_02665 [bacterium]